MPATATATATALVSGSLAVWLLLPGVRSARTAQIIWAVGLLLVTAAAAAQAVAAATHWSPFLFRVWYLAGAALAAAWLGLGSFHLQTPRPVANAALILLLGASATVTLVVVRAPVAPPPIASSTDGAILSSTLHYATPWLNVLGTTALVGGALRSLWRLAWNGVSPQRALGLTAIAVGALLAAAGGTLSRLGHPDLLAGTVLAGVVAIAVGSSLTATAPPPAALDAHRLYRRRLRVVRWTTGSAAGVLFGAVVALPILPWPMAIVRAERPSYTDSLPTANRGAYLLTSHGVTQLYTWLVQPDSFPDDAPTLDAASVREIATVQKAFDRADRYQLFELSTGTLLPWRTTSTSPHALRLVPPVPLHAGSYMLVVPSDGMYGGQSWHYFRIR